MKIENGGFNLRLFGDLDFEGMVVEVCFNDELVAMINYEKGIDNMELEWFFDQMIDQKQIFPLEDVLNILQKAKELALRCAKEDELRK